MTINANGRIEHRTPASAGRWKRLQALEHPRANAYGDNVYAGFPSPHHTVFCNRPASTVRDVEEKLPFPSDCKNRM
ncbi:hypothetical protein ZHAS_00015419 [Anopheles sinensis]|uniref:Uncharacterized protein n=1 Tax=Anopheles sinensis TaxID=74873 RepID=A0A084WB75_ANOSI|nr:hypothetical protein ZHAS_00015419 [Anopheles sinensis]